MSSRFLRIANNFSRGRRARGFSIITAIFLLVVLAALGAFMVVFTGLQQTTIQADVLGVRAYYAARAGSEWGAFQVLDPDNTLNPATCAPPVMASCPGTTHLSGLGGSLSPFTVSVECAETPSTEGNRTVHVYQITATACNKPAGGSCLGVTPDAGYVERKVTAVLSKCKDPTAATPRCSCG